MGIFSGSSSPLDQDVELATSDKHTTDDWAKIVDICDKINDGSNGVVDGMKAISKRIKHENPRVQLQTITLLDACINNCGRKFLLKVAEREFEQELYKLLTCNKTHPKVSEKLRECLKKWAEGDFHGDSQLGLIPSLYMKLQQQGYTFDVQSDSPKPPQKFSTDPNVVDSQQEEDDIAKAIQLSLQGTGSNSFKSNNLKSTKKDEGGLYPSTSTTFTSELSAGATSVPEKEVMKVRALYDFEAAEDNELTFKAGEIIVVSNNNDANWWEGSNHRGEGLFPSNFVTDNLYETEEPKLENLGKKVSFSESVEVTEVREAFSPSIEPTGEIDEDKINQLLHILHEADPTAERPDDPALPALEEQANAMAPTIDVELEKIDRMHAQLARISTDLVGGLSLYHQLMRDMPPSMQQYYSPYSQMQPGMVNTNISDLKPPHFMQPMGMPQQMYPQPGQIPPYMGMPTTDPSYIPHTQPDMANQSLPPCEYAQGQPPSRLVFPYSYTGHPAQVNFSQYPYSATTNASFESPIYSQSTAAMTQAHVSGIGPYPHPLSNMMDPAGQNTVISNPAAPGMMMQNQPINMHPPMHLPHSIPGQVNLHGIPAQMPPMASQYPNSLPQIQSPITASMAPQTSVSYQPPVMQQPLL